MNVKRMILAAAILAGTSAMIMLPGCADPIAAGGSGTTQLNSQPMENLQSYESGMHDGWYYSFWWNDKGSKPNYRNGSGGSYSVTWNGSGTSQYNFTCGKGWETGSEDRVVEYSGTFNPGNNGYLALYGWTENPVVEYYVVESYGSWTPPGATSQGTMTSDGATYNLYKIWRENQPWIKGGNGNFWQYWSVRTPKKSTGSISGTITFKNHVTAWRNKGWSLADFRYYQIMETEGWESSGNSSISVHEPVGNQPVPHPAPTNLKTIVQKHGIYRDVILNWTKPNSSRVKGYYVYIDDRKVASVFGTPAWGYQRVKPFDHHRYKFYVIALYVDGAVSEPSNIVTYKR